MANAQQLGRIAGRLARRWLPISASGAIPPSGKIGHSASAEQLGRMAGRAAGRFVPSSEKTGQFARQSGLFVKHVVPAAVKPLHSLWHRILGFFFLVFAGLGAWRIWSHPGMLAPAQLAIVIVFIVVMAAYGISSIRKSRRISRS